MRQRFAFTVILGRLIVMSSIGLFITGCGTSQTSTPEPAKADRIPHADTLHGDERIDSYYWLRQRGDEKVLDYLKAENEYTEAMMRHTVALQETLFNELRGRIKETDQDVPVKDDDYFYYSRTVEGKQYKIHARKKGTLEAEEKILLDVNKLAEGYEYFDIGVFAVSPNHQLLLYSVDTTGNEEYTLYIKDLSTGELFPEQIDGTYANAAWSTDNQTFFYVTLDHARRPYRLYRHRLGTDPAQDPVVFQEDDEKFWLYVAPAKSEVYIFITLESQITSEVHFLPADEPEGPFKIIEPRRNGIEYSVYHHGNRFLILTNDNAKNFRLVDVPVDTPGKAHWREIIAHRDSVKLDYLEVFKDHFAVFAREQGLRQIDIHDVHSGKHHRVTFPEPVYHVYPSDNPDFLSQRLRFVYTSLTTPNSVYDYDMETRERELKKQEEVLGGYDPGNYTAERIFATADDGTRVPISLVYRRGALDAGPTFLVLHGYGSYGSSYNPRFSSHRLSLLDRGVVYAMAHVRGGGELGRGWYEAGKLLNKRNTFTDFIACAEHLIAEGYTTPDKLAISGGSAGGLLIGATINMRPELFHAAVADVPFVDVVNTMADSTIPLTVIEFEEWGNPFEKRYYEYMLTYSPYDNVTAQEYPHLLVTAGLNDPRVQYWEPAKWTAKLRHHKIDNNRLLLKTNMGAGHLGYSGRYDYLKEYAFEYAFLLDRFGITE